MQVTFIKWEAISLRLPTVGSVSAVPSILQNSVRSAEKPNPQTVGNAPAVPKTRVNSALNAALRNPKVNRCTVVTSADGSPKTPRILPSSVPSVATVLTIPTKSKG